jgi:hypothetical protein
LATGRALGTSTITATWYGVSGFTTLTIRPAELVSIAINPTNVTIPAGYQQYPYSAAGTFDDGITRDITTTVLWASSDTAVATISNEVDSQGKVIAGTIGTTLITASSGSITQSTLLTVEAFSSIAATPLNRARLKGTTTQLSAVGTLPGGSSWDITSQATWSTSDESIAVVSMTLGSMGRVTAVSAGTATITAAWGTISGSTSITVSPWTPRTSGTTEYLFDVTWTGTQFIAVRSVDVNVVSSDGITWSKRSLDPFLWGTLYGVCSCGPRVAAVGNYVFLTSYNDGVSFSTASTSEVWSAVTCSDAKFVAVGGAGSIMTSTDWLVDSGTTVQLYGITWSGEKFVAVGANGTILNSADGISWATVRSAGGWSLRGVAWSGTQFAAVGDGGIVLTSSDGVAWTTRTSATTDQLFAVTWTGNQFVAVGNWLTIISSADGVTWTNENIDGMNILHGVASSGTRVVAVGRNGTILTLP